MAADLPFSTSQVPWRKLDTTGAISVLDPACIIEPDLGYLFVIGGVPYNGAPSPGIQIYNINTGKWNEPSLREYFPSRLTSTLYRPSVTFAAPEILFVWAGAQSSADDPIWTIDLTSTPWQIKEIPRVVCKVVMRQTCVRIFFHILYL